MNNRIVKKTYRADTQTPSFDIRKKIYPLNFSKDITNVINLLKIPNTIDLMLVGSSSLKIGSPADIDAFCIVKKTNNNYKDIENIFNRISRYNGRIYIDSIKCGEIEAYRVIPKDITLSTWGHHIKQMRDKLQQLLTIKVITKEEYNEASASLKDKPKQVEILLALDTVKFHIIRWTATQMLKGEMEYRGIKILLKDVLYTGRTKISIITYLYGYRYVEISLIYRFKDNQGRLTDDDFNNLDKQMRNEVLINEYKQNWLKMAKRMMSILRGVMEDKAEHKDIQEKLFVLFRSDLGRIYQIISDVDTMLFMITEKKDLDINKMIYTFDQLKNRLGTIVDPQYVKNQVMITRLIDMIEKDVLNPKPIEDLKEILTKIMNDGSLEYLKKEKLYPVNKELFLPKDYISGSGLKSPMQLLLGF